MSTEATMPTEQDQQAQMAFSAEQNPQTVEIFTGVPVEIPAVYADAPLPDDAWRPGAVGGNNGLTAIHDEKYPIAHLYIASEAPKDQTSKAKEGGAFVPFSNSEFAQEESANPTERGLIRADFNAAARQRGVQGREIEVGDQKITVLDPFDKGQFIDMAMAGEVGTDGKPVQDIRRGALRLGSEGEMLLVEQVGKFDSNNGKMAWVTPEGRVQMAPLDTAKVDRLLELGYARGDVGVPMSNGELFPRGSDKLQTYIDLEVEQMAAADHEVSAKDLVDMQMAMTAPSPSSQS